MYLFRSQQKNTERGIHPRTEGLIGSAGGNKKETSRQSVKVKYNCILNKMKIFFMVVIGTKGCVD